MQTFKLCQLAHTNLLSRLEKLPQTQYLFLQRHFGVILEELIVGTLSPAVVNSLLVHWDELKKDPSLSAEQCFNNTVYHLSYMGAKEHYLHFLKQELPENITGFCHITNISSLFNHLNVSLYAAFVALINEGLTSESL
jgi:hypothetical protein